MLKVMAILRSIFLTFILAYAVRGLPIFVQLARTFDEQYARCQETAAMLQRAVWYAVAWIALETTIGWVQVIRSRAKRGAAVPGTPPPTTNP